MLHNPQGLEEARAISELGDKQTVEERQRRRLQFAEKLRLVNLAHHYGPTRAAQEMGVGRDTVYYWLGRYEAGGSENLRTRRRGKQEARTVTPEVRERLLALKAEQPKRSSAKVARLYTEESGLRIHRSTVWAVLKKGAPKSNH